MALYIAVGGEPTGLSCSCTVHTHISAFIY